MDMTSSLYSFPHQFEPLLPQKEIDVLRAKASQVVEQSLRLGAMAHAATLAELRVLLREMNSYYSNRIEGQGPHPYRIRQALLKNFSDQPDIARLQRVAVAHIQAEIELELLVEAGESPYPAAFVQRAHAALYGRLAEADRTTADGLLLEPGGLRRDLRSVGHHVPPTAESLPAFFKRYDEVYAASRSWEERLIAIACAHQRMAWIHPFADGNGRAVRLHTHAALFPLTQGLWSVNRGLARRQQDYYARLADADEPRQGDLDGRGNLSEQGLRNWCHFFLDQCLDQVGFMARMLDLGQMKARIRGLISFRMAQDKALRPEAVLPLYHLFAAGPVSRGEFQQMTGLGQRVSRALLSRLISIGLVKSASHVSPVSFALPLDALQFLLPELYPEAAIRVE